MKILVTGKTGTIGSHVTRQLVEAGHSVLVDDKLSAGCHPAVLAWLGRRAQVARARQSDNSGFCDAHRSKPTPDSQRTA